MSYGDPKGYTAMAKTVGYPCAIATKMVRSLLLNVIFNIDCEICFHLRFGNFLFIGSGWRDPEEGSSSSIHKGNDPHICIYADCVEDDLRMTLMSIKCLASIDLCVFAGHLSPNAAAAGP